MNKVWILVLLFLSCNIFSDEDSFLGYWIDSYPVPSGMTGYIFLKDGSFIYDNMERNEPFVSLIGEWSVKSKKLYVSTKFMIVRDEIESQKFIKKSIDNNDFREICSIDDMEQFNNDFEIYKANRKVLPFVIMKNIRINTVDDENYKYLKIFTENELLAKEYLRNRILNYDTMVITK